MQGRFWIEDNSFGYEGMLRVEDGRLVGFDTPCKGLSRNGPARLCRKWSGQRRIVFGESNHFPYLDDYVCQRQSALLPDCYFRPNGASQTGDELKESFVVRSEEIAG